MLSAELVCDVAALAELEEEWDELARACHLPLMAPGLVIQWWRHLAPAGAQPRSVIVRDGGRLVGLAPFYVVPRRWRRVDYRLPGIQLASRLSPLAAPNREWEVARLTGEALSRADPKPDLIALEGHPMTSPWPLALRDSWPGRLRPALRHYLIQGAPTISLQAGSYEAWLATKSSNFRNQMRRMQRKFVQMGGVARLAEAATFKQDIASFMSLHSSRWEHRGHSAVTALGGRLPAMLADAANGQDSARLRLWVLEVDGEPVSAQLFFAADGEVAYINGGWDERFAQLKPAMLGILYAIEDAFARGERRIDLGGGEQPYKLRFADGNDPVAWSILMPFGRRLPLTRARTAPMLGVHTLRETAKRGMSPEQSERVRALRRRLLR